MLQMEKIFVDVLIIPPVGFVIYAVSLVGCLEKAQKGAKPDRYIFEAIG